MIMTMTLGLTLYGQEKYAESGTVTLESRRKDDTLGTDNYVRATYSFEKATNGESGLKLTRNDWDIQFSTIRQVGGIIVENVFDVTMVTDDRSRLKDLGELNWSDDFNVPGLPAHEKPKREPKAEAIPGHIYLVHTADRDSDFYALFRLDEMKSGESATITWKRIPAPVEK
jgi:hypothetical protein